MVTIEEVEHCPACGDDDRQALDLPCLDRFHGVVRGLEYALCNRCGVVFLVRRVREADIDALYPDDYHAYAGEGTSVPKRRTGQKAAAAVLVAMHRLMPHRLTRSLHHFYRSPRPAARLLDFGCGSESFLERAARLGWDPVGIDFTSIVVDDVRARGYEAFLVEEGWDSVPKGSVHALRMNHVLEHLYDPRATLARLHGLLAEKGRIHVATPNPKAFGAMIFGEDWRSFDARHVALYGPRQAVNLLAEAGFRRIKVVHEFITKDLARSWGYRRERLRTKHVMDVEALAEDEILNALFALPAQVAAWARRSDRFHVFAMKA